MHIRPFPTQRTQVKTETHQQHEPCGPYLDWEKMNPQPSIKQTHCSNNSVLTQHVRTTERGATQTRHSLLRL